jgi:hypothetical protein
MKKLAITLSDEDFSMLEKLREHKYCPRTKSQQIAWLIKCEWERLQKEKQMPTLDEIEKYIRTEHAYLAKKAGYIPPCADNRIIPFPVRQIRQFTGGA